MSVTGRVLFRLTLCLPVLVAAASASAAPRWRQIVAPHFVVIGDASPRAMRGVAEQLEQFRAIFERLFPKARVASPIPTPDPWVKMGELRALSQHHADYEISVGMMNCVNPQNAASSVALEALRGALRAAHQIAKADTRSPGSPG